MEAVENFVSIKLPCAHDPFNHGMDDVIDVRTPLEYAEDHIPGAINLPVLSNTERHEIGKEYASNSFEARKNGAALISSNISKMLKSHFIDKPKTYSCLVYCWRGGQRSRSLALILSMIGFNVKYLSGGYKAYRRHVVTSLSQYPSKFSYKVIGGMTGCGKTLLLNQLVSAGAQVLDFEALANHKGSVLGMNYNDITQPSPKMFESMILGKMMSFTPTFPVWVEAEGRRIGNVQIPHDMFEIIKDRVIDVYELQSTMSSRVKYLLSEYEYLINHPEELKEQLSKLSKFNAPIKKWFQLIDDNKREEFVSDILENHYDPLYKKSQTKSFVKRDGLSAKKVVCLDEITEGYLKSTIFPRYFRDSSFAACG